MRGSRFNNTFKITTELKLKTLIKLKFKTQKLDNNTVNKNHNRKKMKNGSENLNWN